MAAPFLVPAAISIASEFFPVLATRMGGQRGRKLAEDVIDIAATVAGTPRDADPRDIIASLKKDQSKAAEVRLRLEELDQEEHQRVVEDRMDARRYQERAGRKRGDWMLIGVITGLVSCIAAVIFGDLDPTTSPAAIALLTTIAGALLKMLSDAFAFEFGSSSGSKEKTQHIETIQRQLIETARENQRELNATRNTPPRATSPSGPQAQQASAGPRDFVGELLQMST
ncbi:hypothetical protein [Roseitranquillus sediminis]|uniref:hypothetical protein n=1 Tax=Roseitranquillus sediminis TaxID=2809051 RepID=UPI001D0C1442|nr:hypothetical protein [Roseitranquillus sediminis]MBM9595883.1 hypothetical protein [Roseitranquillus sediminis]